MKPWTSWRAAACLIAGGLLAADGAGAADALYAVGLDANGVGDVLASVAPAGAGVALRDGSVDFSGGLAWSATDRRLYTIGSDSTGNSYLTSLALATPTSLSSPVFLGQGFFGGLASNGTSLFALASDGDGNSSLYSVGATGATLLGALGAGFVGGLTYDTADHDFYAIDAGGDGIPDHLARIGMAGGAPTVDAVFDLGDGSLGFTGGLAYDAASNSFTTIANDGFDPSELLSFALAGGPGTLTLVATLDGVFTSAGLAYAPAGGAGPIPTIPEPPAGLLLAVAGVSMLIRARIRAGASTDDVA